MIATTDPSRDVSEREVIGALLIAPQRVSEFRPVLRPDHFQHAYLRMAYGAMVKLDERGELLGAWELRDELVRSGAPVAEVMHDVTGAALVVSCSAHLAYHVQRMTGFDTLTKARASSEATIGKTDVRPPTDACDVVAEAIDDLSSIGGEIRGAAQRLPRDKVPDTFFSGTGIHALDGLLGGGLHSGQLYVLGAATSVGKSSLAQTLAYHVASYGKHTLYYSLEMTAAAMALRMAAMHLGEPRSNIHPDDFEAALREVSRLPFWIDDGRAALTAIESETKLFTRRHGPALVVVDYLQLVRGRRAETRQLEVAEIVRALERLAKATSSPVLACSQLNRAADAEEPRLADLRESGEIEQAADVVLLLARSGERATLWVAKNRHGPTGKTTLAFVEGAFRFRDTENQLGFEEPSRRRDLD